MKIERRPYSERRYGFPVYSPVSDVIVMRFRPFVAEVVNVKQRRVFHQRQLPVPSVFILSASFVVSFIFGHRHTRVFGEVSDRPDVIEVFHGHYERYHVAASAATEALEKLPRFVHRERRSFFGMSRQRTACPMTFTFLFKHAISSDDIYYVVFLF